MTTVVIFAERLHRNDRSSWEERPGQGEEEVQAAVGQLCSGAGSELAPEPDPGSSSSRHTCGPAPGVSVLSQTDPSGGPGLCRRLPTGPPHSLPQEIVHKGHAVTEETFSFLLMGCIQDKKTGFRHALQVRPSWLSLPACLSTAPLLSYDCVGCK